jgi:hypothetical protein
MARRIPDLVCAAVLAGSAGGGCNDFEAVGVLAAPGDAGTRAANAPDGGSSGVVVAGSPDARMAPVTIDDCRVGTPSNLDAGTIAALLRGGEGAIKPLYPYNGTVFPRGLGAPLLMWDDGAASEDAVYVRIHSSSFDYRDCLKPSAPGQLRVSQEAWNVAGTVTTGAADPFTLELTVVSGSQVFGPMTEQVIIATGSLPGSIYYMTESSKMTIGPEGTILRVQPGQTARIVLGGISCVGCHSVSADGTRLVAYDTGVGTSLVLGAGSQAPVVASNAPGGEAPGLTPDGTLYVASAHPTGVGPRSYGAGVMNAGLYDAATGNLVPDSGIPAGAMVPSFSPEGSALVFNDFAINGGRGLAVMDFSETARAATHYRAVFSNSTNYPAWPSFLPDGKAIVFQLGAGSDFSGGGTGLIGGTSPGPASDLFIVDVASGTVTMLAQAMGFATAAAAASNVTYLPFGSGDLHQNYGATVSPATSGGYAWVFFDSMRHYGNAGLLRQIWGAAVDVSESGTIAADPSHPAFFLPGQELGTGNFRAVAALDP